MRTPTRRRVVLAVLVVALTLPLESVLLQAVSAADSKQAAAQWVASLSVDSLAQVANDLQNYPQVYRRAILAALTPDRRSAVVRGFLGQYLANHIDLSDTAVSLINQAIAVASPQNLSAPPATARAQARSIGEQLKATIGTEDAMMLLYQLGPKDGTFASHEPLKLKASNWLRSKLVAVAAMFAADCDCNQDFGGCGIFSSCKSGTSCNPIEPWPACGWLWMDNCDGQCTRNYGGS